MPFEPKFTITPRVATCLMQIEAAKQAIRDLPMTTSVLVMLRETARLHSTHYSTMIEGNRLSEEEVSRVIERQEHFPGRERDEKEVLGYYAALEYVEQLVLKQVKIKESHVQTLHALVMAGGRKKVTASLYRDGQNVIRDSVTRQIVYLPPESQDVPELMRGLIDWIQQSQEEGLPCPLIASIAHYQFATIHPYYDGNGRTARLLTTLILHLGGYDLKGIYSLEEYYARDLGSYYEALTVGPSHNYYLGRALTDVTKWVEYFCAGVVVSFESVKKRAQEVAHVGAVDHSNDLKKLEPRQRKVLELFHSQDIITSVDVEKLFVVSSRTARHLCKLWVTSGFLVITEGAKKNRKYGLAEEFRRL